jgi:hypothetical protein
MIVTTRTFPISRGGVQQDELFELHELPSGARVWYCDAAHQYCIFNGSEEKKGRRMTSASSLGNPFQGDTSGLTKWSAHEDRSSVAEVFAMQGPGAWLDDGAAIDAELVRFDLGHSATLRRAGERGTAVHTVMEALAAGGAAHVDHLTDEAAGHATAVLDWWARRQPDPILCEEIIIDPDTGVVGRFDLLCALDGEPVLLDLKTSNTLQPKHFVQVAAYIRGIEVSGYEPVPASGLILHTSSDGSWREVPVARNDARVFAAAWIENERRAIESQIRAAKKQVAA